MKFKKNQFLHLKKINFFLSKNMISLFGMVFQTRNMTGLEQTALFTQRNKVAAGLIYIDYLMVDLRYGFCLRVTDVISVKSG